jgi:hypothetical protein
MVVAVIIADGVDDLDRSLGRCRAIEVDEGVAIDLLIKNRKVRPDRIDIELVGPGRC